MCGFTGIINYKGLSDDNLENKMNLALKRLYPRGPDQQDQWRDNKSYFVHSRLSILDTSEAGKQPMNKYGKVIVYNGEIYNFKELKLKLVKYGYNFTSGSDCEVLLAGWDKWGIKVLDYLNGMYAFALWDIEKQKLSLVRDPYGKKPLYYIIQPNGIAFSSDLKSLEKIINTCEINLEAVESLFSFRFIHDPLTIYKNVKKLSPGNILELDGENNILKKWYNLRDRTSNVFEQRELNNKLNYYFDESVKRRLISDVPLGLLLSGGIDSSLILSSIAGQGKKIPCFTMGFKDSKRYYEERPEARRLANYFGMEHHDLEISSKSLLKMIPDIFAACDEPFADTSSLPFYALSKEVSKTVTVALSGDGGDEVFGGYRKYNAELWQFFGLLFPELFRKLLAKFLIEDKGSVYGEISRRLKRYLLTISSDPIRRQINWLQQINQEDLKLLLGSNNNNNYRNIFEISRQGFSDKINSLLAGDLGVSLPGDMLVKTDRMSMANSLEIRSPFLDKDLVEYAFSIPGNYKVGYFRGKKVLRRVFKNKLPSWSRNLPKKGFEVPIADWLKKDLKTMIDKVSMPKNLDKIGIKNHFIINKWKTELFYNNRDTSWQLWTLISYYNWHENRVN